MRDRKISEKRFEKMLNIKKQIRQAPAPTTWNELRENYADYPRGEEGTAKKYPYTIKEIKDALLVWVIENGDGLVEYDTNATMPKVQEILYGDFSAVYQYALLEEVDKNGDSSEEIAGYLRLSKTGKYFLNKMEKAHARQAKQKTGVQKTCADKVAE